MNTTADRGKKILKNLADPGESLGEKTAKGGFWISLLRIFERGLQLVRTIVLARILAPGDFGVYGIALLTLSILETFSETGFQQALIQKKHATKNEFNVAWTIQIIKSSTIAALCVLGAPLAAIFFDSPEVVPILRVIGLAVVLVGFSNIAIVTFEKDLKFSKYFQYRFLGSIAETIAAVAAAIVLKSVWALVIGLLVGNLVRCVMSYVITKFKPKFVLKSTQTKSLWGFGKWIFTSSILSFGLTEGDDIVVGKLQGTEALGFYQLAYRISNLPALEISNIVSRVTFPAYATIQDRVEKLKSAFLKVLQPMVLISIPISGFLFIFAYDFTVLFLGDKWVAIVPAMQLLVWWGAIRGIISSESSLFLAIGKPKLITVFQIIQTVILYSMLFPLTVSLGFIGTSIAVFITALIMFVVRNQVIISELNIKVFEFYKDILLAIVLTAGAIGSVYLSKELALFQNNLITSFAFGSTVYLITYLLPLLAIDSVFKLGIVSKNKEVFQRVFKSAND